MAFGAWLQESWYCRRLQLLPGLLLPLALLFRGVVILRCWAYRRGWLKSFRLPVPVVVVGNLTVGGVGKTPLVLWLARELLARGWRPGIISRGYGGRAEGEVSVGKNALPALVGDEPLLLAVRSNLPVWVGRDRVATGRALLAAHPETQIILCDDGLQHYRLARDVEVAVFDGRGVGNALPLPAGPLRESLGRLRRVRAIVFNGAPDSRVVGAAGRVPCFPMQLQAGRFYRLGQPGLTCLAADFQGRKLHGVAGIGDPGRFFRTLTQLGLIFESHPFPDHHVYRAEDLAFARGGVVLMTEKDGVKCASFTQEEIWVLPVDAQLPPELIDVLLETTHGRKAP